MKKILIMNGSYTDVPLIKSLKKLGLYIITLGLDCYSHRFGDIIADEHINIDYSNKDLVYEIAKSKKIDYICPNSNDLGVITSAYVAEKLSLPGNDLYENACIYSQKDKFKEFAINNNLSVIPSYWVSSYEEAINYIKNQKLPLFIKPVDSAGGNGCSKISSDDDINNALKYAFEKSKEKRIVIEPYVTGSQHSITTFLINKKVASYASCNEFDSINKKYLVGYDAAPADNINEISKILIDQIEIIANKLKLMDGIFHIQYILVNGKPLIMETMRRCLGNYYLRQVSEITGFCWEDYIAKSYCGLDCSDIPHTIKNDFYAIHYYIPCNKNGVFHGLEIDEDIDKYIYERIMVYKEGEQINDYKKDFIGYVYLKFDNKEQLNIYINKLSDKIKAKII